MFTMNPVFQWHLQECDLAIFVFNSLGTFYLKRLQLSSSDYRGNKKM